VGRSRSGADGPRPGACGDADPAAPRAGLDDIDLWEINEAFAAQVLGCLAAWESDDYCREQLGLPAALGALPRALNVDGGAVAIGHPVGASGARIVLHLLHGLRAARRRRGIAAICIGGGQGGAMLVEAIADGMKHGKRHEYEDKRHWRLEVDAQGAWATLDKAGESTNSLSAAVMDELGGFSTSSTAPAEGADLPFRKAAGFIAGADIQEFTQLDTPKRASRW
jgi:hypothetical protein